MTPFYRDHEREQRPSVTQSASSPDVAVAPLLHGTMSRRSVLRLLAASGATVAAAPLLDACGGASGSGSTAASGGGGAAASGKLDPNGTLKITYHLATSTMDPLRLTFNQLESYIWPMYDRITYIDLDAKVKPMLATKWEYGADGKTLALTLRDDVKFHDGTQFTADAVKVNLERLMGMTDSPYHGYVRAVTGVEVKDPTTAVLTLSEPDAALPAVLGTAAGAMVSPKALKSGVDLNTQDAGSGAYKLVNAKLGAHAYYERFDGYWDAPAAAVKRLEIHASSDGKSRLNGLRTSAYDLAYLTPTQYKPAKAAGFATATRETLWYINIATNWSKPSLKDRRVRLAIAHAIDREAIAKSVYFGLAVPTSSVFPHWYWAASPKVGPKYFAYDPEKSKRLLAQAGAHNVSFEMIFAAGSDPYPQFSAILQQQLKKVGITMHIRPVDINQLATEYAQGNTDALLGGGGQIADPSLLFRTLFTPDAHLNPAGTTPHNLAAALSTAEQTPNQKQREGAVHKAVEIIADDGLNIPIVTPKVLFGYNKKRVPHYTPTAIGAYLATRGVGVT